MSEILINDTITISEDVVSRVLGGEAVLLNLEKMGVERSLAEREVTLALGAKLLLNPIAVHRLPGETRQDQHSCVSLDHFCLC